MCVLCAFVGVFCAGGCLLAILFGCGWWCLCERLCAHVVLDVAGRVCLCVCVFVCVLVLVVIFVRWHVTMQLMLLDLRLVSFVIVYFLGCKQEGIIQINFMAEFFLRMGFVKQNP